MNVVEHRPPLKRIDFGLKSRPPEPPAVDIDCIAKFQEQERVWKLLKQAAQGQGSAEYDQRDTDV